MSDWDVLWLIIIYRPIQGFPHGEGSSQDIYVHPMMTTSHIIPTHYSQFSPSRLGQQPVQRFNHGRSMGIRGAEWNHVKQAPLSNFNSGGPRSPGSSSAPWGIVLATWPILTFLLLLKLYIELKSGIVIPFFVGRRGNHPIAANILPSSHGGNEYGRIAWGWGWGWGWWKWNLKLYIEWICLLLAW